MDENQEQLEPKDHIHPELIDIHFWMDLGEIREVFDAE